MDVATARALVGPAGRQALTVAGEQADPSSLSAAAALRRQFSPELAAAALQQVVLRGRARAKLGIQAEELFLTEAGLQQATRPVVARWRAQEMAVATPELVVADLGCGLGIDAMAMRSAGLAVRAIERDPVTAILAAANLGTAVENADATEVALSGEAVFADPARRVGDRRTWQLADISPPWSTVSQWLRTAPAGGVKLGPGAPHDVIGPGQRATWIGVGSEVVELALWSGEWSDGGANSVVIFDRAEGLEEPPAELLLADADPAPLADLGRFLHEPHPAVAAAHAVDQVAAAHGWSRLARGIAYLTGDLPAAPPWVTSFAVREVLPLKEKVLRSWVREHRIGTLEIKKRGIDLDPAQLRRQLRPKGPGAATLILTPTRDGAVAVVAERL